ncbi:MAG: hypothetical protein IRD7MM_06650 [Candidatus Midichloria mitochondrii]|uniref:hypothetical protein n=1 Tax=Candidatus Midichloria mitochondrii TaxID=234827 RepID=UPI0002EFBC4C|nr:hypothetical protein [Candidatus Midichloria mitochondrii]MDJ1256304.1 hypothetical protein [Candidatus Midichloria mitochondrii]MDJ1287996.1 hypothetical protein [Candidatus Midichloria mitochondrii]MDJ1298863.1 hypothetical protein [Candidatus Midichloria mitochondrii]MDJ1313052.1 hypothetical protein [Candidatus Midichloria mitochondrii]MDJ1583608.1 hypothetical protein [Candidatus Midichloria mitochondrii]
MGWSTKIIDELRQLAGGQDTGRDGGRRVGGVKTRKGGQQGSGRDGRRGDE